MVVGVEGQVNGRGEAGFCLELGQNPYFDANRDFLHKGFTRGDVKIGKDFPKGLVQVRLIVDAVEDASRAPLKNVACEEKSEKAK
jgi:hypothetical protein